MNFKLYLLTLIFIGQLGFSLKTANLKFYKGIITSLSTYQNDSIEFQLNDSGESKIVITGAKNNFLYSFRGDFTKIDSVRDKFILRDCISIICCRPLPGYFGIFYIVIDSISFNKLKGTKINFTSELNAINDSLIISESRIKVNLNTGKIGSKTDLIQVKFQIPNISNHFIINFFHNSNYLQSDICISSSTVSDIVENIFITRKMESILVSGFDIAQGNFELK